MKIKFKKLNIHAITPSQAKEGDSGWDLTATEVTSTDDLFVEFGTGLAIEIPEDHVGLIFPRSSISKYPLSLANSIGVIDPGYRGEIKVRFRRDYLWYEGDLNLIGKCYTPGDRIAQLVIIPRPYLEFEEVKELGVSERSSGGFGSSGK
jgi:dUTP pyrophosphatase